MGIVYKAEDTKLDRTVALKLLPPHALASEDDRARFYREARAAAALNHPNIAHVYEIDESDVEGEGKRPFIAMEYIDGESLAGRVAKGPLPLQDAISIATQVADGLKAAHEKDIVHRDVKSGNIMLTSAGVPKILDFGLAKTAASTKLTQMGSTLGTVAYMSPEQARGEEVDRRSDVWSLGVILYEMVSGRMPFLGDYEQATIYGILNAEPEPLTGMRTGVPMELERIVSKCLVKDAARRYQSTTDLVVDLEALEFDVRGSTMQHSAQRTSAMTPIPEPVPPAPKKRGLLVAAIVSSLIIGVVGGLLLRRAAPEGRVPMHLSIVTPQDGGLGHPSMSPDGQYVAYSASGGRLILHDLSTEARRVIVSNADARISRFSPDGRWLAFEHGATGISIMQVPDGTVARLTERGQVPSWIDNEYLIFTDGTSIFRISRITQQQVVVWEPDSDEITGLAHPEVLPDGEKILVTVLRDPIHGIGILDVKSGEVRVLRDRAIAPKYVSSGHLVFTDQPTGLTYRGRVFAQPFDYGTGQTRGPAVPILSNRGYWELAISERGDLITTAGSTASDSIALQARFVDPSTGEAGASLRTVPSTGAWSLSVDGKWFAYADDVENILAVGPTDPSDGGTFQFSTARPPNFPSFSNDGNTLYYTEGAFPTALDAFRRTVDGGPPEDLDFGGHRFEAVVGETPDGRFLSVFVAEEEGGALEYLLVDKDTGEQRTLLSGDIYLQASISPNGQWIAFSEGNDIYIRGVDGAGPWRIASQRFNPKWSKDGITLYVRDDIHIYAIPLTIGRGVRPGTERVVYTGTQSLDYDVNRATGQLFVVDRTEDNQLVTDRLDVVLNWGERLRQEAPVQ